VQGMEVWVWCPFIVAERWWGGEEVVAGVGGFLEGFGYYGEEKRRGVASFRVEERRWLGSHSLEMAGGERSEGARGMVVARRWWWW
jgi:hypothetical protein